MPESEEVAEPEWPENWVLMVTVKRGLLKLGFPEGLRDGGDDRGKRRRMHGGGNWSLLIISEAEVFPVEEEERWTRFLF